MTLEEVMAWLEKRGSKSGVDALARYGIVAKRAVGVSVAQLHVLRKKIGTDQALSLRLWDTGVHEAKLLAAMIGDPARVTKRQMNAWARSFESWADTDTACFKLFDQSPHAWDQARAWIKSPREFIRRGGYVLMACLALHDKKAPDARFLPFLELIERGADDERNFVKKGVNWALRGIGKRKGLKDRAKAVANRLAASDNAAARWVGKDALRQM